MSVVYYMVLKHNIIIGQYKMHNTFFIENVKDETDKDFNKLILAARA